MNETTSQLQERAAAIVEAHCGRRRPLRPVIQNARSFLTADEGPGYLVKFVPSVEAARLERTVKLHELVRTRTKVPVPRIEAFEKGDDWAHLLREVVAGETLSRLAARGEHTPDLYQQAGRMLAELHQITFPARGIIRRDFTVAELEIFSQAEYCGLLRTLHEADVVEDPTYDRWLRTPIEPYFEGENVFCHGDFTGNNLIVHEGEIVAVVDFEWAMAAPCMDDLATLDVVAQLQGTDDFVAAYYDGYRTLRPLPETYAANTEFYRFYRTITMLAYQIDAEDGRFDTPFREAMEARVRRYAQDPEFDFAR
jgi:aminoglycoside phosphotransferase (APT) family kinase protein